MPEDKIASLRNELKSIQDNVEDLVDKATKNGKPDSALFKENNPDIDLSLGKFIEQEYNKAEALQARIEAIQNDDQQAINDGLSQFQDLKNRGSQKATNTPLPDDGEQRNDLTAAIMESEEFKEMVAEKKGSMSMMAEMSLKTLFAADSNTANTVNVESVRDGDYVPLPRTRVTLLDLIPQIPTTERVVKYDREKKNLSAAQAIAQGAAYSESEFEIEEATANVIKIGCYLQVSEELLDDAPEMRARIDTNLDGQMMRRAQSVVVGGAAMPAGEYVTGADGAISDIVGFLDIVQPISTASTRTPGSQPVRRATHTRSSSRPSRRSTATAWPTRMRSSCTRRTGWSTSPSRRPRATSSRGACSMGPPGPFGCRSMAYRSCSATPFPRTPCSSARSATTR